MLIKSELRIQLGRSTTTGRKKFLVLNDPNVSAYFEGNTGSGKSTLLFNMIQSLASSYSPEELKIYLGDLKKVEADIIFKREELSGHLMESRHDLTADSFIQWLDEIDYHITKRLQNFSREGAVNFFESDESQRVIVIIDELTSVKYIVNQRELEQIEALIENIVRKARAAGFHLIATGQEKLPPGLGNLFATHGEITSDYHVNMKSFGKDNFTVALSN